MKQILIFLLLGVVAISAFAQKGKEISGIVLSNDESMPLINATIMVPAADLKSIGYSLPTFGIVTDLDGRFSTTLPAGIKRFVISYIGYKSQEITLGDQTFFSVRLLPETSQIEEVVVTGYQNIEKRKMTGSVSKIKLDDKLAGATLSVDQMLQGQLAGVSVQTTSGAPGAAAKIRIRGTSSLSGSQDPLWVLDGIPLEGTDLPKADKNVDELTSSSIAGLNPSDIESITVLKDAAATAIYGARAANGVIVITTKNGKKGEFTINYSHRSTFLSAPNIDRLNLMNSDQKVGLELDLLRSNDYTYRENKGDVSRIINNAKELALYKEKGWDGLSADTKAKIDALRNTNTDWNKELFRSAYNQEHSLSISGGNDNVNYYFSFGFYDEKGATRGVDLSRYNLTSKTQFTISPRLKFGVGLFANQRNTGSFLADGDQFTNPLYYSRRANPYQLLRNADGSYAYDKDIQGYGDDTQRNFNILEERSNTSNDLVARSLNSVFDLEYKVIEGLRFTSQLGFQFDYSNTERFSDMESYATRKVMALKSVLGKTYLPDGGIFNVIENRQQQYTLKNMLQYDFTSGENHEFEVLVGNELRKNESLSNNSIAYGYDRGSLTSQPVVFPKSENAFPLFTRNETENAFVSFFSTANYTLMRKYTLGGSIRFDGSDLFGVDERYRYLPLYSVSGSWRVSEEAFLNEKEWLSSLVFRTSYGVQGNIDKNTSPLLVGKWGYTEIIPGNKEKNIIIDKAPNEKLRWEKTQTYNVGVDFAVLKYAISTSLDYYYRKSSDLIGERTLPLETGFFSTTVNWAKMENRGYEVNITTRNIKRKDFEWTTNLNVAFNENKVNRVNVANNQSTPSVQGYPVGALFVYKSGGLDSEGYPLFIDKQGNKVTAVEFFKLKVSGADVTSDLTPAQQRELYTYAGTTDPKYTGGLSNTFKYKSWSLLVSCAFNFGHVVRVKPPYEITNYDRGLNAKVDILNRWTPENTNTSLPRLITKETAGGTRIAEYNGYSSYHYERYFDTYIRKGDNIRVQTIRLGYEVPSKALTPLHLKKASLALELRNFFVWGADYDGYLDPETMSSEVSQPISRSVTLGLNIAF